MRDMQTLRLPTRLGSRGAQGALNLAGRSIAFWIWGPVVALVAIDSVPSTALHPYAAAIAVGAAALLTHVIRTRQQRTRSSHITRTISALRERADTFQRDATTDRLTGIHNRMAFYDALEAKHSRIHLSPDEEDAALLMIDLNDFKAINDTWGHHVGDDALAQLARVIQEESRVTDVVGRLGGDEFAILATGLSRTQGERLAERVRSAIAGRLVRRDREGREVRISASVGVASLRSHAMLDDVFMAADRELYTEKSRRQDGRAERLSRTGQPNGGRTSNGRTTAA